MTNRLATRGTAQQHIMAEHHTQGRQGQGARRRRNNHGHRRQRMPRAEKAPTRKPSLLQRILTFFGFGKKATEPDDAPRKGTNKQPRKNRQTGANNQGGNPAAPRTKRRPASTPPTRNARLYVGNLSYEATEAELEDLFKGFGNVRSVEIIYNTRTYKSKGYAFVEMHNLEDARRAAEVLHGQPFMGRELMVSAASEKAESQENRDSASREQTPAATEPTEESEAAVTSSASQAETPADEHP